jgi:hypothetical protein
MIVPIPVTTVQVNQDNSLFVTTGVDYDNSGTLVGSEITAQYTLHPGDSLEGQPPLWTQEMIDARLAKLAAEAEAKAKVEAAADAQNAANLVAQMLAN